MKNELMYLMYSILTNDTMISEVVLTMLHISAEIEIIQSINKGLVFMGGYIFGFLLA